MDFDFAEIFQIKKTEQWITLCKRRGTSDTGKEKNEAVKISWYSPIKMIFYFVKYIQNNFLRLLFLLFYDNFHFDSYTKLMSGRSIWNPQCDEWEESMKPSLGWVGGVYEILSGMSERSLWNPQWDEWEESMKPSVRWVEESMKGGSKRPGCEQVEWSPGRDWLLHDAGSQDLLLWSGNQLACPHLFHLNPTTSSPISS